ncbi:MAG: autotransporter-associated beta strand repeat-containing protein, partial [Akkermansiaceae bacterium]|nr:autotransporter-associated beta strand repeat-containing protein [Verrucomicrobiales bacterium]
MNHTTLLRPFIHALIAIVLVTGYAAGANDPGGGTNGIGANVTLTDNGSSVTLGNGTLTATITKSNAKITSLLFRGRQMVVGDIYFSMDGGSNYEQPSSCVFTIKTNTADMVDIGMRCFGTNRIHKFDIEVHYVLRRGDSGLYAYAVLDHPANYPDTSVGEWRMVWKMNQDQTERIYVDDIRHWQKPSAFDLANAQATGIAEIVKLTTGLWAGRYTCKYMYLVEYEDVGCYGHASNPNKVGAWAVFGNFDYFNDGPTKQDLAPADGIIHIHFGRNHINASSTTVSTNEAWTKFYGPWLLYCNTNSAGGDACWADAKAQVAAEKAAQPYSWLVGNLNYPPASGRGTVTGKFVINDPLKPALTGSNAWVGLAQPEPGGNWQFESKRYQYWVRADTNGNFVIPHVRPGTFTLYAFVDGAVGEFSKTGVTVAAGATNAQGDLVWNVPHPRGQIAWEIGVPDRTAKEFRHGTNYWEPYLWERYSTEFPNPLEYTVGTSNWTNDWNYAHTGYLVGTNWSPWKWRVNFTLTNIPASGSATLTLAWASANYGAVQVFVNNESSLVQDVGPSCYGGPTGGNGLIREAIHAKYGVNYVSFPVSLLRNGTNTITLIQRRSTTASDHVMYDYLSLELPPPPAAPPPGRNLRWLGGVSNNAWDINNSLNWINITNGVATTFTNGDNVTFDDNGSNNVPINMISAMLPGAMVVNAAKNFTISGNGSLAGTMALQKSGTGRLILNGTNTFNGGVTIDDGIVQLGSGETNNAGVGIGPITFLGGTLQLNGYAASTGPT